MKYMAYAALLLGCVVLGFNGIQSLGASEVDKGLVIIDNEPWKVSWVQDDKGCWVLKAYFDQGILSTYFKAPPPKTGLGLSPDNKPIKQEFEFHLGKKFTSTDSQFEQWTDGAKAWAFLFEQPFERGEVALEFGTTAIIQEVAGKEDEIRYALLKDDRNTCDKNKIDFSSRLDELPIQEQLAHKQLMRNLDILEVHLEYNHCQNTALINLMELLEENKDKNGSITNEVLEQLVKKSHFPKPEVMKSKLEKIAVDKDAEHLVAHCLKLITNGDKSSISEWFLFIAKETELAINSYEKMGLDIPQYKYMLGLYEKSNQMIEISIGMLVLMNPKIFGE